MPWQHLRGLLHEAVPWSVDALSGPAICGRLRWEGTVMPAVTCCGASYRK